MKDAIVKAFEESIQVKRSFLKDNLGALVTAIDLIAQAVLRGNKFLLFGNGGSAADAQHIAAEFVNRFRIERPPLPALALAISASGNAANVLAAIEACKKLKIVTIGLTGGDGGKMARQVDCLLRASEGKNTARIQENHILVGHVIAEMVDQTLFAA